MTSRALSRTDEGVAPVAASLDGMRWAFAVSAALCLVVLLLVTRLPVRIEDPEAGAAPAPETAPVPVADWGPDDDQLLEECAAGAPEPR